MSVGDGERDTRRVQGACLHNRGGQVMVDGRQGTFPVPIASRRELAVNGRLVGPGLSWLVRWVPTSCSCCAF